ncbi:hypothetical protein [Sphingomonas sp. S-NIH.Pt15_0812]|jgi:hypothetical protein|uniref:hypothetical protein n=1 Tax=Sphingomonas sp. S-NIH.Pt15_0812 TaxID=1920129 RepID=UPI000F7F4236|nr:hypothetical protein [Sphingomonas sp. S-NIH.Pt15_0812]
MPLISSAFLPILTIAVATSTPNTLSPQMKTAVVGYLDVAGTTVTLYRTRAALKAKDSSMCIDATMYPLKSVDRAVARRGHKVTAIGYVVSKAYYSTQQGDDIAQGVAPIQGYCRSSDVMTIITIRG